ncbi:hypothetical protein CONPUDRAFT_120523 [Coniophora puteana RWD-64-598 SS2]|uniref:Uncharacterized protein n=1 Tax=Coniophora puteana (strain RWD-64-598) TaxID=741705 RepID=A0A5M3MZG8_CONPW|nr:uncharacterized protein CONPUDRAFT_120523 [Coniophora puteana RWD-64-598 SS2]EIW84542.1 hypothetical protein CONPUDRAFT_120523 [Coniophora puteana RWD-64-598 SS2]
MPKPEGGRWSDARYDKGLQYQLMSDDEDSVDEEGKWKGYYRSRRPKFRSDEHHEFLMAVDAVEDPEPSIRYVKRLRGEETEVPIPYIIDPSVRARRWQIKVDWLEEEDNKKWDRPNRITENGKEWGNDEDPEELIAKKRKVKEEKGQKKRARVSATPKEGKGKAKASVKLVKATTAKPKAAKPKMARAKGKEKEGVDEGAIAGPSKPRAQVVQLNDE